VPTASLGARVAKSTAWIVSARFVMRAIGFINTIIVARLLVPEDFGLIAVAVTAMQMVHGFSNLGISQAVVKFRDMSRADIDTLFTISLIRSLIVALIVALGGFAAAAFYDDARFVGVFAAIALVPLFRGLVNPRFFEFEREMDFSREFYANLFDKLVAVTVSITAALLFRSYWALILGLISGAAVQLCASYIFRPYRPGLSLSAWRRMLGLSGWIAGASIVITLNNKMENFILGRVIGIPATGVYYLGGQLANLITADIAEPIARAIYPGLSETQNNAERMRQVFLAGTGALAAIALPLAFGMALVAPDFVRLVLGEKWLGAIPVLQIITPALGLQAFVLTMHYYGVAADKVRLIFIRETGFLLLKIPVFIWAAVTYGFMGAVWAGAGLSILYMVFQLWLYARISGKSMVQPLFAARRSIIAVALMSLWFLAIKPPFLGDWIGNLPLVIRLVLDIAFGAIVYVGALFLLWRAEGAPAGIEAQVMGIARPVFEKIRGRVRPAA